MKYMLLIYGNEETWSSLPDDERNTLIRETDALNKELQRTGEMVGAYGVADDAMTSVVRVRDGATTVTDGPYLEAKECLASFTIVDCETPERAAEIAALNPASHLVQVEIRPIMHEADPADSELTAPLREAQAAAHASGE